jgi:beta-lactamase class A
MENVMTPRETASLLSRLLHRSDEGPALLQLMEWNSDRTRLGRYLPDGVTLAHKDGWMEKIDNDAGVVRSRVAIVVAGFTTGLDPLDARPLLGLLGLAAASLAGAEVRERPREAPG